MIAFIYLYFEGSGDVENLFGIALYFMSPQKPLLSWVNKIFSVIVIASLHVYLSYFFVLTRWYEAEIHKKEIGKELEHMDILSEPIKSLGFLAKKFRIIAIYIYMYVCV